MITSPSSLPDGWNHRAILIVGLFGLYSVFGLCACRGGGRQTAVGSLHFTKMDAGQTKIAFNNRIMESDSLNVFVDEYIYNGAGVGVGDFNGDGLPDLFFCGSMTSSRLYINKGNWTFEDVTASAGLQTTRWCTGVSVVDINNDGFPDIYVCASHSKDRDRRKNMLFINDGKLHFTDQAEAYGLADTGYSTQAAFLDYDHDGDLDVYVLNHQVYSHTANNLQSKDTSGHAVAEDRLYRNDGVPGHPVFHDVSSAAGIKEDGYGLGVVVSDIDGDGWPDIYVANDYIANDLLWLNNRNGTFANVISSSMRHQSYNSMGVDAADINNDGLPDLAVVDMLPETNERKKMMASATNQSKFDMQQRFGYQPSYVRNMLQLNEGCQALRGPGLGQSGPFFSEIGQLAGIFQTDWSWSVLVVDLDNDGWKDIHITNGLGKDVTNNDYTSFGNSTSAYVSNYAFDQGKGTKEVKDMSAMRRRLDEYGSVKMESYLFKNTGGLVFKDVTKQAGMGGPSISNGAVYVDLDNDGDLDLVTNNIDQEATVWRNDVRGSAKDSTHNFLVIEGTAPGAKVSVYNKGMQQFLEESPVRGFCSSVDSRLYFGVGDALRVDSVKVQWPDGAVQMMKGVMANQWIRVRREDAVAAAMPEKVLNIPLFQEVPGPAFRHAETPHYDFGDHQPILQKYSQMGPCVAVGDVNGDGLEDFFVGGAANQSGRVFIQQPGGTAQQSGSSVRQRSGTVRQPGGSIQHTAGFLSYDLVTGLKPEEDLNALFFDADGDKDLDLLITGGSSEFQVARYNQPRLYLNDGKGHFTLDPAALPAITDITRAVAVADYDGDGDMDVFIGGRLSPQHYPSSPRSYILQNDHGRFRDVTATVCPSLAKPGMITDAVFTDLDKDGWPDLVVSGEWMEVSFFKNDSGKLKDHVPITMHGLWRCMTAVDLDKDGDIDLVAGNMGLNHRYGVAADKPMMLYAKDMDGNGMEELIPAYYIKDKSGEYRLYPAVDRNQLAQEIPAVKKKYLLHKDYAQVTMARLKEDFGSDGWTELKCQTSASVWLENLGGGKFKIHELPLQVQFAPVNCIVADDVDGDGAVDLVIAGNEYQAEFNSGQYDASYGWMLKGDGKGGFTPMDIAGSGLILDGDIRGMKIIHGAASPGHVGNNGPGHPGGTRRQLIVAPNNSELKEILIK